MAINSYEYIVIGSGAAGGVLAHNLHMAGAEVLLIEAGKFYRKNTFPKNEADATAKLYWGGGAEFNESGRMLFLRARLVGGTTIVNQALVDRFDDIAFDDWKAQSGVDFFTKEAMAPHYEAVENFINCYTFSGDERNENAEKFVGACKKLNIGWKYLRRAQDDCALEKKNDCIACLGGCHRDSKQSTMATYIQTAEKHGLQISASTEVQHIENHGDESNTIFATKNGLPIKFNAKNVILCGGAFGTTQMLLRSGYKKQLPALGKYFSSHPQFMSFGRFDEKINSHKGYFQTVASSEPSFRPKGFKLEIVYATPISIAMLFPEFGADHQNLMRNYGNYSCIEVATRDENVGEIKIDKKGKLVVKKQLTDQDNKRKDAGLETVRNLMETAGAKEVIQSQNYFGLHLMGGSVMGVHQKDSVVAPDFRLHGYKNIYVADSSLFPNAPGINPSLTVMALAQKLSTELIR